MQLSGRMRRLAALAALASVAAAPLGAGVLPDDRADILYHRYEGGGVTIDGPSVLVRKKFGEKFAASANYYVDMVSSASIDVETYASPYEEKRTQRSIAFDYLRGKSTYSAGVITSKESDYTADTAYFAISQDLFGDLTTITMSFKRGWDDVYRNVLGQRDPGFHEQVDRRSYGLGLTQILTRNMILGVNYEVITDEGFLNNPYRQVRFQVEDPSTWASQFEIYPRTRTSNAASARLKYFLPYRAALEGWYRFYTDTWGIDAHTIELGYTHPWRSNWIFDARTRYYRQNAADFYRDLFPRENFANFMARDKELATYQAVTVGVGASYEFQVPRAPWIQKSSVNLRYDRLFVSYDDYRDARLTRLPGSGIVAGTEPLYELDADVIQVFLSVWF